MRHHTWHAIRCFGVLLVSSLLLCTRPLSAQTLQGRLLDAENDRPVDLGLVIMLTAQGDSIGADVTNPEGRFSLSAHEPGSFLLLASAWGYRETADGVFELGEDGVMTVDFRIRPQPMPLEELVVELGRPVFDHHLVRNGFVRRYQRGLGWFITPHDIENSPARETEALLRHIPGVNVVSSGATDYLGEVIQMQSSTGGRCSPAVFVDGIQTRIDWNRGERLSTYVPLATIDAVEVYRRAAEIPVEYGVTQPPQTIQDASVPGTCGVILFWTRER